MTSSGPKRDAAPPELERMIHSLVQEELRAAASDRRLNEELALALLTRRDLQGVVLEDLSKNHSVMKHRKVIVALVCHPRTPRFVSLPIARRLYTFELMKIATTPAVPADVKMMAEESLISRLQTISSGERLTLAKQGTTKIAAALLPDAEERIRHAALLNPRMTEPFIVRALLRDDVPEALVSAVARHSKWSLRKEIQIALLRSQHTPLAHARTLATALSTAVLRELLANAAPRPEIRALLNEELRRRS